MTNAQLDQLSARIHFGMGRINGDDCDALHTTAFSAVAAVTNFIGTGWIPHETAELVLRSLADDLRIDHHDLEEQP